MIERIIIENFKSIHKLDLDLRALNVLIGANGAGKTNFISFFKLLNQIYEGKLQQYIANNIDRLLYFGRKESEHIWGLIDFSDSNAVYFRIKPDASGNSGFLESIGDCFNGNNDKTKDYFGLWHDEDWNSNVKETDIIQQARFRANYVRSYLDSFRIYHFHDTGEKSPIKQMSVLNDNRYLRANGENLAAYLFYLKEKHFSAFNNIEQQIRSVAPFFNRFDLAPDRRNDAQIELRWLEKSSDNFFNAYSLSDGTLRFIALTTLLMQPGLPATIIIDEPELGLHPFAINKLGAMMKSASVRGSQVIISTQSTNLIDNFEPEDIVTVDRNEEQSVFKRLDSEELKDWLEDYTIGDLWNKNILGAMP